MEKVLRGMTTVNDMLKRLEKIAGCFCLGTLFVVMITNAALRYCFQSGFNWSDELNQFLFVWLGFLSAAYTMGEDNHLSVTALTGLFPESIRLGLKLVMNGIVFIFFLVYIPALMELLGQLAISNVMRIPLKYVYAILPISFGLMCFHVFVNSIGAADQLLKLCRKGEKRHV